LNGRPAFPITWCFIEPVHSKWLGRLKFKILLDSLHAFPLLQPGTWNRFLPAFPRSRCPADRPSGRPAFWS
jgi:hypothetical protein